MPKKPKRPAVKQPTSPELLEELLRFIQTHFYPSDPIGFVKDRPRLLSWVVLRLATWLEERAVTLPPARYLEIVRDKMLMEALRHGNTSKVNYRPAWLRMVVQSHLDHHGEDYYEEGKSIRALTEHAILVAGQLTQRAPDPVRDLATLARLQATSRKAPKATIKAPVKQQLTLL
jgi:hypothetical protein